MRAIKDFFKGFTIVEYLLLIVSTLSVLLSFFLCGNTDYLSLTASLIGVFSLILVSKGDVLGHLFTVIFSVLYGTVSYFAGYYGEMITYLGMTAPMAIISAIAWLRHPHKGKRREVEVNSLKIKDYALCTLLTACVTTSFYFILRALGTASLIWSNAPLAAVRARIRSQRYCLDSLVVDTGGNRPQCDMYDSMLFRILAQRYLRLYQLAAYAPQTAKGQKRRVVSIIAKYMLR